jgi:hypothetical protein
MVYSSCPNCFPPPSRLATLRFHADKLSELGNKSSIGVALGQVENVALYIDADIAAGIAAKIYVRTGGTVRNAMTGAIIKHLDEAAQVEKEAGLVSMAFDAAKKLPVGAKIAVVGVAAAGLLTLTYQVVRAPVVKCAKSFKRSLEQYLESLSTGVDVNLKLLKLQAAMKELREISTTRRFTLVLAKRQAQDLINVLNEYTVKLALAHSVSSDKLPEMKQGEVEDLLREIEIYLEVQAHILNGEQDERKGSQE